MSVQFEAKKASVLPPSTTGRRLLQRQCACEQRSDREQREESEHKGLGVLLRSAASSSPTGNVPPIVHDVLRSPGRPLDPATRAFMEPRFGQDFSQVRVHTDTQAAESARSVHALAYTVGKQVVFNAGQYKPGTSAGNHLIAHELAHVVQQSGSGSEPGIAEELAVNEPDDPFERQADGMAAYVARSPLPPPGDKPTNFLYSGMQPRLQRQAAGQSSAVTRVPAIVEDGQPVLPGQMHRTEFLFTLRDRAIQASNEELNQVGRSANDCPYIVRTAERLLNEPIHEILRFIYFFGHPSLDATAQDMMDAVVRRTRSAARRLAASGEQPAQARMEEENGELGLHDPAAIRAQLGSGHSLDGPVKKQMERSFGVGFSSVRIHDDGAAARLNKELGARAFTIGKDVVFGADQYRPGTLPGDALIAHELTHTLQQEGSAPGASNPAGQQRMEREADRAAIAALGGQEGIASALQSRRIGTLIQRGPVAAVVLAGALAIGEVGADVAVVEGSVLVVESLEAPAAIEATVSLAPEIAAGVEGTVAPTVVSTTTAAATTTTAAGVQSAVSTATVVTAAAATTLSGDTSTSDRPKEEEKDPRRKCFMENPGAIACDEPVYSGDDIRDELVALFLVDQGLDFSDVGSCSQFGAPIPAGNINDCGFAPAIDYHCTVKNSPNIVSIFACLCCDAEGIARFQWSKPHWSTNLSSRGG